MRELKSFAGRELKTNPRQVQIFTPLPSTYSSLMYFTEIDPAAGKKFLWKKNGEKTKTKRYRCGKNYKVDGKSVITQLDWVIQYSDCSGNSPCVIFYHIWMPKLSG